MEKKNILNVDDYLLQFQGVALDRMKQLRVWIKEICPESDESISYGMPAYKFQKKPLIYFAAYEKHIGVYATPNVHASFAARLTSYKQGKGSVQFPLNEEFPETLIKDMVLFRKELILKNGK